MPNADYYVTYGSLPSTPLIGWFLDGNFSKTTLGGITTVTFTLWPAAGPRSRQRSANAAVISAQPGAYSTDSDGKTKLQYNPTLTDCQHPVGWYVGQWTINSSGSHVDIWPDNEQLITWYIAAATS